MARSPAHVSLALALAACAREPLPEICPNVEPGALVISELRGNNTAKVGDWIELHNVGASEIDLEGLRVRLRLGDGTLVQFLVRENLELLPGGYVALGAGLTEDPDAWLGYAVGWDIAGEDPPKYPKFPASMFREQFKGSVELEGCDDELIDVVEFEGLPTLGTLACGNAGSPPDAEANDDTSIGCWCVDAESGGPSGFAGFGTPGEPNRCP